MPKPWKLCLTISAFAGLVLAGLLMWMAWDHNPQCEIHCAEQGIDWGYWLALGVGGWLIGFLICMVPASSYGYSENDSGTGMRYQGRNEKSHSRD